MGEWGTEYVAELIEEFERRNRIDAATAANARWYVHHDDLQMALQIVLRRS